MLANITENTSCIVNSHSPHSIGLQQCLYPGTLNRKPQLDIEFESKELGSHTGLRLWTLYEETIMKVKIKKLMKIKKKNWNPLQQTHASLHFVNDLFYF